MKKSNSVFYYILPFSVLFAFGVMGGFLLPYSDETNFLLNAIFGMMMGFALVASFTNLIYAFVVLFKGFRIVWKLGKE